MAMQEADAKSVSLCATFFREIGDSGVTQVREEAGQAYKCSHFGAFSPASYAAG